MCAQLNPPQVFEDQMPTVWCVLT